MSCPGAGVAPATQRTITIENGDVIPADKDVCVKPRAIVKFSNNDPRDYAILLFVREAGVLGDLWDELLGVHADVDLFLPAFGTVTTVAGIGLKTGRCVYRIVRAPADSLGRFEVESIIPRLLEIEGGDLIIREQFDSLASGGNEVVANTFSKSGGGSGGGGTIHIGN